MPAVIYIHRETGAELTEPELIRALARIISPGDHIRPGVADQHGYDYCVLADPPAFDANQQKIVRGQRRPSLEVEGTWEQGWEIVTLSMQELAERRAALDAEIARNTRDAIERVDREREQALTEGVEHGGKRWHIDTTFAVHLVGLLTAYREGVLAADATCQVRTMSNTVEALTRSQITTLAAVVMQAQQAIYARSWAAKDQLRQRMP